MYTPKNFIINEISTIVEFIEKNSFAVLITLLNNDLKISHIPLDIKFNNNEMKIYGHLALKNDQINHLKDKNTNVTAIFKGNDHYISSSWYKHENVPTWNYSVIHIHGKVEILDTDKSMKVLEDQIDKYEKINKCPAKMSEMDPKMIQQQLAGIIVFELNVDKIETAFKLSQNRKVIDLESVINELKELNTEKSLSMASEIKNINNKKFIDI